MTDFNLTEQITQEVTRIIADFIPIGTVQCFSMERISSLGMWMPCDGRRLKVSEYEELYYRIGNTYGGNDQYFRIPDLRGCFIRGWDEDGILDPQRNFGSYQEDSVQDHSHLVDKSKFGTYYSGAHSHKINYYKSKVGSPGIFEDGYDAACYTTYEPDRDCTFVNGSHSHSISIEDGAIQQCASILSGGEVRTAMETRPKNVAMHFCIRVK